MILIFCGQMFISCIYKYVWQKKLAGLVNTLEGLLDTLVKPKLAGVGGYIEGVVRYIGVLNE